MIRYIAKESLSLKAVTKARTERRSIFASSEKEEMRRWQTLASSSRRSRSSLSKVLGRKEYILRAVPRKRSSVVGLAGSNGTPLQMA